MQYLLVNKKTSENGEQEKIQFWDSKMTDSVLLPFSTLLKTSEGKLTFYNSKTNELLKEILIQDLPAGNGSHVVSIGENHQVTFKKPYPIPGAFSDKTKPASNQISSSTYRLHLYEGIGDQLIHFGQIESKHHTPSFDSLFNEDGLTVLPFENQKLTLNDVPLLKETKVAIRDLENTVIRNGSVWWKFGFFSSPMALEESEFVYVDVTEAKQDNIFKGFLSTAILASLVIMGWVSLFSPKHDTDPNQILDTTEVKIDRSELQAKSLADEIKPVVAKPIEVVPPPTILKTEIVQATPAPATELKPTAKVAAKAEVEKIDFNKKGGGIVSKSAQNPNAKGSGGGSGGGNGNSKGTGSSGSSQILTRHSKMLQDAFGSVMGSAQGPDVAPAGAGAVTAAGAAMGKGSGIFNSGSSRELAGAGTGSGGGAAGMIGNANPGKFVKTNSGGPLGAGGSGGYGGGAGKIEVSGQGSGIQYSGSGFGSSGGSSALTHGEVTAVFQKHVSEVRMCYESAMINQPDLHGTITLAFSILSNGSVKAATIKDSDLGGRSPASQKDTVLGDCLKKRVSSWVFPKPRDGREVQITAYPLVFKSLGNDN